MNHALRNRLVMPRRIFISVAEVSGDQHAAQLVQSLRQLEPSVVIEGIGGPLMKAAGCEVLHETVSNAAMGLGGVARYFELKKVLKQVEARVGTQRPDLMIGVDSPSMNFHFAKLAKSIGVPFLQYVAPQVWAWREGRVKKIARTIDRVACILPFEEAYFRGKGVNATFVGHPLFDELPQHRGEPFEAKFPNRPPVIGLLPGSRKGEALGMYSAMLRIADRIKVAFPTARFVTPTVAATHAIVTKKAAGRTDLTIAQDAFDTLVPQCDLCVVASGTATLHVAGFGVPMVVVYRGGSRLAYHGIARWLIITKKFSLVNLLAERDEWVAPEFIPWFCDPEPVAASAIDFLKHPEKLRAQHERLKKLLHDLDRPGASTNVARIAIEMMSRKN
jgi:lipid-A-disaccharide synthase